MRYFSLFILFPIIDIFLLVQIGYIIGPLAVVALVILGAALGGGLIKRQGRLSINAMSQEPGCAKASQHEMLRGSIFLLAGLLLIFPGFLSDLAAILLLIPLTRRLVSSWFITFLMSRMNKGGGCGSQDGRDGFFRIFTFENINRSQREKTGDTGRPDAPDGADVRHRGADDLYPGTGAGQHPQPPPGRGNSGRDNATFDCDFSPVEKKEQD